MLTIWTYKITHSTLGSSFSVTFSVPPTELEYLNKLYDYFNSMNMTSFYIAADRKDEPQYDFGEYADRLWKIAYERGKREALEQTEPPTERSE